jgi:hypothetical protein
MDELRVFIQNETFGRGGRCATGGRESFNTKAYRWREPVEAL